MKPQSIGIVGGAGPLAGALFLKRVLSLSGSLYGCYKDADFPKVLLISFPFSDMLSPEMDVPKIKEELRGALSDLRQNGATILAIACNTLHAFLDEETADLIRLPEVLEREIPKDEKPLVLCTSTSVQFGIHKRFFPCIYPSFETQKRIDMIIDQILKGKEDSAIGKELLEIIEEEPAKTIVLGCTELSLFTEYLASSQKLILDPLEIGSRKIVEKSFSSERGIPC